MFDSNQTVEITIPSDAGVKHVKVRFPSDQEMKDRQRKRRLIIKDLGRGRNETIQPPDEIDLELFETIRLEGDELDAHEAAIVIQNLTLAEATDVVREGNAFRVYLRVAGTETEHILRIPTQKQVMEFRRNSTRIINLPFGQKEVRVRFEPVEDLYAALRESEDGYADGSLVPVFHKAAIVSALIQQLDLEIAGESEDPAGFDRKRK